MWKHADEVSCETGLLANFSAAPKTVLNDSISYCQ